MAALVLALLRKRALSHSIVLCSLSVPQRVAMRHNHYSRKLPESQVEYILYAYGLTNTKRCGRMVSEVLIAEMDAQDRTEHFRQWLRRFFRPNTNVAPSRVSLDAGLSNSALTGFLLRSGPRQRGLPRADTLVAIVPILHHYLIESDYQALARECTVVRLLLEAGYLSRANLTEYLAIEGLPGWMQEADCVSGLDLHQLSPAHRWLLRELYLFLLERVSEPMPIDANHSHTSK